jgi:chromosome segregation ATPase
MPDTTRLEAAQARLTSALSALEEAARRRLEAERGVSHLKIQYEAAEADRARLAEDLDRSMDRIATLETTNRDVARKLDQAIETVRQILAANGT